MLRINKVKQELKIYSPENLAEKMLSDINGGLDMWMAGALREYLFPYDEYDTLGDKLDEIVEAPETFIEHGFVHNINIFPAKEKTTEIFPDFLCVCRGKTRLAAAFSQMKTVSDKMVKKYGHDSAPLRNVLLITDKWDDHIFRNYEADFLYKAINYDVWFVFLLLSGDNLQQIPFLPNKRNCFSNMAWAREHHFEEEFSLEESEIKYPPDGFMFEVFPGTWNQTGTYWYRFDPMSLSWQKESVIGDCKDGRIPKNSLDKFMRNVQKLIDENAGKLIPENNSCDDPGYLLDLFGKDIRWAYSDTLNNPEFKRLQLIIDEFIQKCDKEYLKG